MKCAVNFTSHVFCIFIAHVQHTDLSHAFKTYDKDNSGSIDRDEFRYLMYNLDLGLGDNEIEMLVREADADNNGDIDFDEFQQLIQPDPNRVMGLQDKDRGPYVPPPKSLRQ
jgi:Ca2+-binding EF-hand superfamily protein